MILSERHLFIFHLQSTARPSEALCGVAEIADMVTMSPEPFGGSLSLHNHHFLMPMFQCWKVLGMAWHGIDLWGVSFQRLCSLHSLSAGFADLRHSDGVVSSLLKVQVFAAPETIRCPPRKDGVKIEVLVQAEKESFLNS